MAIRWFTLKRILRRNSLPRARNRYSAQDNGESEAVEALDAYGLQGDGAQARLSGHHLKTTARVDAPVKEKETVGANS